MPAPPRDRRLGRRAIAYARAEKERFVRELGQFVRFPSVSASRDRRRDLNECAIWLASHLRRTGIHEVELVPTGGAPFVLGRWTGERSSPTVLIYGHYDVQPPGPVAEWATPPFSPTVKDGRLYGRGTTDDKGQLFAHVKAIEALLRTTGRLPVNVICLFEGEEESGSPRLAAFLLRHSEVLRADIAVMSDTLMRSRTRPAIISMFRGVVSAEIEVDGPPRDLHSGTFGGAVRNPVDTLAAVVASLHDPEGKVAIEGFYDRVREWTLSTRSRLARDGPTAREVLRVAGVDRSWGVPGYSVFERTTILPAITVTGISGGYAREGSKAIVPSRSIAKVSARIVPRQDPQYIYAAIRRHVIRMAPPGARVRIRCLTSQGPIEVRPADRWLSAADTAYRLAFGASPVVLPSGGTVPFVALAKEILGVETLAMGFGLPAAGVHGANEHLELDTFGRSVEAGIHFLTEAGRIPAPVSRDAAEALL